MSFGIDVDILLSNKRRRGQNRTRGVHRPGDQPVRRSGQVYWQMFPDGQTLPEARDWLVVENKG